MAKYSDGNEACVGDVVRWYRKNYDLSIDVFSSDDGYASVSGSGYQYSAPVHELAFISRAPSPAKAEPLVKWPEGSEELGSLKWGTLFVLVAQPDVPCVARSHGDYVPISGEMAGTILIKSKSAKVRRIQFNPANKEPVFIVI